MTRVLQAVAIVGALFFGYKATQKVKADQTFAANTTRMAVALEAIAARQK